MVAKPSGTPYARRGQVADHLAQRGVLAADLLEVGQAEVGEPEDVAHEGLRGVSCCRITVDISSTERVAELTTGTPWAR